MHEPHEFKIFSLLKLMIQLQQRASQVSTEFGCLLQSGTCKANTAQPRGLDQISGNFLPFHFLSAVGVEVSAGQLFARVGF